MAGNTLQDEACKRLPAAREVTLSGHVQSVGFRPFIYHLAVRHRLNGWVQNRLGEVVIHVQGDCQSIDNFTAAIFEEHPALARPVLKQQRDIMADQLAQAYSEFSIRESSTTGIANISVPADISLCQDCLRELNDPQDRRYRYPFINCTQCGPRYTLIRHMPYDRPNTSMAGFPLCPSCNDEYHDIANRRFHAEPVGCPDCGPVLQYSDLQGNTSTTSGEASLKAALNDLRNGRIVAVKGIGGYHLLCDAGNDRAVKLLRERKPRPDKPLAIMLPFTGNEASQVIHDNAGYVSLSQQDVEFLLTPQRPLLLVSMAERSRLSRYIAPGLNEIGVMFPYSPLHHLLLSDMGKPLVATSANISGDPVLTDNDELEARLGHIADTCLHHNRPIERPADDPVYRRLDGQPRPLRLGRGISPLELDLPVALDKPVLAVGAHMKNTIALAWGKRIVVSPHIGEMGKLRSVQVFEQTINDLQRLYQVSAEQLVCDAHPSYASSRWAERHAAEKDLPLHRVYHHHAHASAASVECAGIDNEDHEFLVFSWDGVGLGTDQCLWGGELFAGRPSSWRRVASLLPFSLPGGDKAGREPWRSAAALCWQSGDSYPLLPGQELVYQAWQQGLNCAQTSSVGRLFDAASALVTKRRQASYEGQGPMELEALCTGNILESRAIAFQHEQQPDGLFVANWQAMLGMLQDENISMTARAQSFHHSLARLIVEQACMARDRLGIQSVSFSGGVFQNRVLTETSMELLRREGFTVTVPGMIPVNDAGISFGQVIDYAFHQQRDSFNNAG